MNRLILLVFVWPIATVCSQDLNEKELEGDWTVTGSSKIFSLDLYFDSVIETGTDGFVSFSGEMVDIKSGVFYMTDERWPVGNYPWVYCGGKTQYKLVGDSIAFLHRCKNLWKAFKLQSLSSDSLIFSSGDHSLIFVRSKRALFQNNIKELTLEVFHPDPFLVNSTMTITTRKLSVVGRNFKMQARSLETINYILDGFRYVNIHGLDTTYLTSESHGRVFTLHIKFTNSAAKTINIYGADYPYELKLALIPLIYAKDLILLKK